MENNFDTIVAIITPLSQGAVGIIRISGDSAFKIASEIFSNKIIDRKICYGHILDNNKNKLDEVILLPFMAPKSYTGEDVIEIQTHGSIVIINEILELIISKGARIAQRGEFTKRAFLNHRIDLSQAEAVLDVIQAKSAKSASNSLSNLEGYLSKKIQEIKSSLIEVYSKLIASIDFPEDVKEVDKNYIVSMCNDNILKIDEILSNSKSHNFIRDGFNIALIGKPNVGKSSLFNALLNYSRAIVTEIAGTTRDTIKETLNLDGYLVNIVDTAGIRKKEEADTVEKIGIENSLNEIEVSDIILFLFENSKDEIDEKLLNMAQNKTKIFVKTKADLAQTNPDDAIEISSKTGLNIDKLKSLIIDKIKTLIPNDTTYTTNKRQQTCLIKAKESLNNALLTSQNEMDCSDLLAYDLKDSILALDEITGAVLTDTILDDIFSNFCIGK